MLETIEKTKTDPKPPSSAFQGTYSDISDPKIQNSEQAQRLKESLWDSRKKIISDPTDIYHVYNNPQSKTTDISLKSEKD